MPQTVAVTKKIGLHYTLTGIVKTDCVVPLGLEPSQTEPKPVVLPLHHGTIYVYVSRAEKGFVMMMWSEASHRHGTRLSVFSALLRALKKGLS